MLVEPPAEREHLRDPIVADLTGQTVRAEQDIVAVPDPEVRGLDHGGPLRSANGVGEDVPQVLRGPIDRRRTRGRLRASRSATVSSLVNWVSSPSR